MKKSQGLTPIVRLIEYGGAEYQQELILRNKVLREPLGLRLTTEELIPDQEDLHLGAFLEKQLIGCLILSKFAHDVGRMRQVAVDPAFQGQGIGKMLVEKIEEIAKLGNLSKIVLNARSEAVSFYRSCGYREKGPATISHQIVHFHMEKQI